MFTDIIYDKTNNRILQTVSFGDQIHPDNCSDATPLLDHFRNNNLENATVLSWAKDVPKDLIQNPNAYSIVFEDNYNKPTKIKNIHDGMEYDLGLNTKIKDNLIIWYGPFLDYISYSNVTRNVAFHLQDENYNIKFFSAKASGSVEIPKDEQERYMNNSVSLEECCNPEAIKVISYVPVSKTPHSACNLYYTMLETFDIPKHVIDNINIYTNEIWVPTEFAKQQFEEHIEDRISIQTIPLWYDDKKFTPNIDKIDCKFDILNLSGNFPETPQGFKFLNVSRYSTRKGIDVLIDAFCSEFTRMDDVCLVMFCRHILNVPNSKQVVYDKIKSMLSKYNPNKIPPIYIYADPIPETQQANMYGWGDCHVMPSRGEGFGLTAIESAACKIPQILTNFTGLSDFVDDDVALTIEKDELVDVGNWSIKDGKPHYSGNHPEWAEFITPFYQNAHFARLGEPAIIQTREKMRYMYERYNSSEIIDKTNLFYERVKKRYTWDTCINKIKNRINILLDQYS